MQNKTLLLEIWDFIKVHKKWWLLPTIVMIVLIGVFIIIGQTSSTVGGLSPFIYALS